MQNIYKCIIISFMFFLLFSSLELKAQNWDEYIKLVASDRGADDNFGYSVSISGDYAIVGAYNEDEDAAGGNTLSAAGSAYIFKNTAGTWTQVQKIVASDRGTDDNFGYSVSISGDYAIIGANGEDEDAAGGNTMSNPGSAYIFKNDAGTWSQVQKIVASDRASYDYFGISVSISGDYVIVGAYAEDEDAAGGNTLNNSGSAYIFKNNAGTWSQVQKNVASDRGASDNFGYSVSISGDYAIVGAYAEDEDASGGNTLSNSGSAYIFKNDAGTWSQVQKIIASERASGDNFGFSVSLSGDYAIVGANGEDEDAAGVNTLTYAGSAYIFNNNAGSWSQVQKIVASDRGAFDYFGYSVSISGDYAIVGAYGEDEDAAGVNTLTYAGSAYIFKNNASTWSQVQKNVASDRGASDLFGCSVSISGDYAIVGANFEDEDASGGNTLDGSGSAYIFGNNDVLPVELTSFSVSFINNEVILNWQTASEINNYGFFVERASLETTPGQGTLLGTTPGPAAWKNIGFIKGNGNSNSQKQYSYIDKDIAEGTYQYRLKQVDNDGNFEYSKIVEASFMKPDKFELLQNYPNPFNPTTSMKYTIGSKQLVSLKVYDILGNEIATLVDEEKEPGVYEVQFNASSLASGVYYYTLTAGEFKASKKLLLVK